MNHRKADIKNPKIALCQIKVSSDKDKNLASAEEMISGSAFQGADIIVLPEMFNCPYSNGFFKSHAESYPGKTTVLLSSLAKKYSVCIIGGSIPEIDNGNIFNSSFSFDHNGLLLGRHRKIHLFDVDIKHGISFKESETITPGKDITIIPTGFFNAGIQICYDMRFPELTRKMVRQGAEIIIVPAAFNMTTGPAHWHLTSRARALDNQVYFIAVSPARDESADSVYTAYGHSLIADPWGRIIAEAGTGEEIIVSEIDTAIIYKTRQELPLLKHLRNDLY
jgi:predicted amidohydrolase